MIFVIIFSFLFVDLFDTLGTLIGVCTKSNLLDDGNLTTAIPAYLCIIAMPLFYSIAEGISIGIISYVLINLICKKGKEISPIMYVLAVLFVLKYIFL